MPEKDNWFGLIVKSKYSLASTRDVLLDQKTAPAKVLMPGGNLLQLLH
jgi:hypothetical protein